MILITQKVKANPILNRLLLSKGVNYLLFIRTFSGCVNIQLTQDIENRNLFIFQSKWNTLEDAHHFLSNGLHYRFTQDLDIQDYTKEISCESVSNTESFVLRQGNVGSATSILDRLKLKKSITRNKPEIKYANSHLSSRQINKYLVQIRDYMSEYEPYKRKDLTLIKFAKEVGLHSHHVSRVINEKLNQNFSDFVNSYRVGLASKLLVHEDILLRYTISGIGNEAGFNSRSAFYNAFRKFTGISPGEFITVNDADVQVA